MLLVVDVGNTNTVFGLARRGSDQFLTTWRVSTNRERMADEWLSLLEPLFHGIGQKPTDVSAVAISSVVPAISRSLDEFARVRLGADVLHVNSRIDLGIDLLVDEPHEVGADRLVNTAYGFHRFGGPLIIVDLGTATKIEAVRSDGGYLGGVIAPGLGLTLDALASRAARLYAVELKLPPAAIGTTTVTCVQAGVVMGHVAMIEGMAARVAEELGGATEVVLTGGFSHVIAGASPMITRHEPDFLLDGLRYLARRNGLID